MHNLFKFEGRIERLELSDATLDALGGGTNKFITSSAILSGITESVSLGAQTVFLASHSKLHIDMMIMEVDGKICIGKFHRIYLKQGDYVVCVAKNIRNNVYELYSVLSPESGLLYMQVGMGTAIAPLENATRRNIYWLYGISTIGTTCIVIYGRGLDFEFISLLIPVFILFYFILFYLFKWAIEPVLELSKVSEKVFEKYGFTDPENINLLSGLFVDKQDRTALESVYEYRRVIKEDPYPESYITFKTKK